MMHRERPGGIGVGTSRAAWQARAVFFLNGLVCASYIASLPALKGVFRLDDGALGGVGFAFAFAALVGMQAMGPLTAAVGAGTVLRVSLAALPLLLIALPSARGLGGLLVAVGAFGAVHGATDAAMNVYAVGIERAHGRRLVNSCHAAWSASAVVASLAMGVTTAAGLDLRVRTTVVAAIALAGGMVVASTLTAGDPVRPRRRGVRTRRGRWPRSLIVWGLAGTVLLPLLFSAVGRAASDDADSGLLVTRFTGFVYTGILLGPAVLGVAAGRVGIAVAMGMLVPVLAAVTIVAGRAMSSVPHT
ncbi:hypothetical protein E4V99_05645 [Microbacterium sp. dk485]|uniref:hypothetical protein n=1 Tax=Microbacterium sp. dk485 TaxID=2560021 RepID=UPI00107366AE|nr:hypothetical protein [Microbacterium sp. dk485]TFV84536.1 hypothetical protein E4V99_05645 [Microbacterium sp. dk485]